MICIFFILKNNVYYHPVLLTATNSYSVVLSARIQIVFMVAKIVALIIIIIGGIVRLIQGRFLVIMLL